MTSKNRSTVGPAIFIPEKHPELTQIGRNAIHNFLKERERYLLRAAEASSQGSEFQPVSLVSSVDFDLLESLINLDTFPGISTRSELKDEVLERWLKDQDVSIFDSSTVEELDAMVRKTVRVKINEPNPKLRTMSLFADYETFLRSKKLDNLTQENPKAAVRHICTVLKPPTLRKKIENDLSLNKACLRKDWKSFYKYIVDMAVACDQFVPCSKKELSTPSAPRYTDRKQGSGDTPGNKPFHGRLRRKRERGSGDVRSPGTANTGTLPSHSRETVPPTYQSSLAPQVPKTKQPPFCLNKKTCPDERHYINKCPKSTSEEKKRLLETFLGQKPKPSGALKQLSKADDTALHPSSSRNACPDRRIEALLADTVLAIKSIILSSYPDSKCRHCKDQISGVGTECRCVFDNSFILCNLYVGR